MYRTRKKMQLITFVVAALLAISFTANAEDKQAETLLDQVISLQLGLNGYAVGEKLSADQKKIAEKNPVKGDAYEGTYKFSAEDLIVVVDKKTDRILAMYQQKKDADKEQLKAMVAGLMTNFSAPTTMAHGKLLYWAFNKHGAVSEDDFNTSKKIKKTPELGIIATVKFSSEHDITPDLTMSEEGADEKKDAVDKEEKTQSGDIYFIITSGPIDKEFMGVD
ncbi:MAG: hypothetical protein KAI39_07035 [Desulfobulbaceae bacterium]|nr:hypothetical protein [Desulfobulbaceae bacterium]